MSTDPLKETIIKKSEKISFGNSHTVILKMPRRVNIKNSKFNYNANNSYEIKSENIQYERFDCPFLKKRTSV